MFNPNEYYCSSWIDGWPTWLGGNGHEWSKCCYAHDVAYSTNPSLFGYAEAHWDLFTCVADINIGMATVMLTGLLTFGFGVIVHKRNKRNGTNFGNGG